MVVKNKYFILFSFILIAIIRFIYLNSLWDLEHDEALILNGAKAIYLTKQLHLTGDKVYEGPLLEYLIAIFFFLFKANSISARLFMAFFGILTSILFYLFLSKLFSKSIALISVILLSLSGWFFMFS